MTKNQKCCALNLHERMMALQTNIEPVLYIDEQTRRPAAFCPVCRGALYSPSYLCLRCRQEP